MDIIWVTFLLVWMNSEQKHQTVHLIYSPYKIINMHIHNIFCFYCISHVMCVCNWNCCFDGNKSKIYCILTQQDAFSKDAHTYLHIYWKLEI